MDSRDRWEAAKEAAAKIELEQLSLLSAPELIQLIERGKFGIHRQAFAALAAKKDVRLAGPVLVRQLRKILWYEDRLLCADALLKLLPYSGIPLHALADPKHRGHGIYMEDLEAHLEKTLRRLDEAAAGLSTLP
jgi:hypothetical protein